ncbi:sensor of ECF-type sigma factor [Aureivirga sp. CE67]|uniref:sensor of ECF-type sigma factor n=1 Tax=Aureivirga sp. CE67 TaxID=1788983 RepID=UPI0018CB1382|nr:sensor of ECF-type sigma factor [Aureivirga sp. CE67]
MKAHIYIITIIAFLLVPTTLKAQGHPPPLGKPSKERMEKIKALKVQYITDILDLSVKEAQQFWPLYNEYEDKLNDYRKKEHDFFQKIKEIDNLNEQEAKQLLINIEKLEKENYENRKEYYEALQKILPAKKVVLLKKAEIDFNRKLLKQFKKRHKEKMKNRARNERVRN